MKNRCKYRIIFLMLSALLSTAATAVVRDGTIDRFGYAVADTNIEEVINLYYEAAVSYRNCPEDDIPHYASLFRQAAEICCFHQHYLEALDYYTMVMEAARKCGDEDLYFRAVGNIGLVYNSLENYPRALYYLQTVYGQIKDGKDTEFLRECLKNLVVTECNLGDTKGARKYNAELKKLLDDGNSSDAYHSHYMDAVILQSEGHHCEAVRHYMAAVAAAGNAGLDSLYITPCILEAARCAATSGAREQGQLLFARAINLAKANNTLAYEADAYRYMAEGALAYNDPGKARRYMMMSDSINSIIYDQETFDSVQNRLHRTENELHFERERLLNERIDWQTSVIVICVVFLSVLLAFFFFIRSKNRKLSDAYRLLIRKEKLIMSYEENHISDTIRHAAGLEDTDIPDKDVAGLGINPQQYKELAAKINAVLRNPEFIFSPDCSLTTLSRECGSNCKYVSLTVNSFFRKNFKSLVNELRVREGARRLVSPEYKDAKIADLADSLGYQSSTVFINAFKAIMGMTPGAYKRAAGGPEPPTDIPQET